MADRLPMRAIDANVILRFLMADDPALSEKARVIFADVEAGTQDVWCDPVTLTEVAWTLRTFYHLETLEIVDALEPILLEPHFLMPDKARYLLALQLMAGPAPHFGDACCCAAALAECGGRLYSFDRALSRVRDIDRREEPPALDAQP